MSQRNVQNERYTGEGPQGQTKKSAAKARPAKKAASTVVQKSSQPQKQGFLSKLAGGKKETPEEKARREKAAAKAKTQQPAQVNKFADYTSNPEYKKWRKVWWGCIVVALLCTGLAWLLNYFFEGNLLAFMFPLVGAYGSIIAAFFIDFKKVRPIRNGVMTSGAKKSNKQLKREQEAQEAAAELEAARKAAKAMKKKKDS